MKGKTMSSPRGLIAILASFSMMGLAGVASAQEFPQRPINLIVPWPAGGPTDITMRSMAEAASKHLGQPVVIENKAGGGGTVGPATMAAAAKPDGYTLAQMPITVYRLPLMQKTTWKADDFTYIIHLTGYVFAVFAGADTPFKTWEDVIAHAKANPGKITYGSTGSGTSLHLGMEMLAEKSGVKFTHVPFKGAAEVNAAVAGGHVMLGASGTSIKPLVDAGKARFLNVWTAKRVSFLPDIPTLRDLGYPYVIDSPWGIAGPKGMDPKVVAKIHDAFKKALEEQPVIESLARFDMVPNYKGTADYNAAVQEQIKLEEALLKRIGMERKD
jgi:tripartite-type tricarboxylate transporter receptor subunit TctC